MVALHHLLDEFIQYIFFFNVFEYCCMFLLWFDAYCVQIKCGARLFVRTFLVHEIAYFLFSRFLHIKIDLYDRNLCIQSKFVLQVCECMCTLENSIARNRWSGAFRTVILQNKNSIAFYFSSILFCVFDMHFLRFVCFVSFCLICLYVIKLPFPEEIPNKIRANMPETREN